MWKTQLWASPRRTTGTTKEKEANLSDTSVRDKFWTQTIRTRSDVFNRLFQEQAYTRDTITLDGMGRRRCCDNQTRKTAYKFWGSCGIQKSCYSFLWCDAVQSGNKIPEDSTASTSRQYTLLLFLLQKCQRLKGHCVEWQDTEAWGNQ
jgi:hypothetical protein